MLLSPYICVTVKTVSQETHDYKHKRTGRENIPPGFYLFTRVLLTYFVFKVVSSAIGTRPIITLDV